MKYSYKDMTEAELRAIENEASYDDIREALERCVFLSDLTEEGRRKVRVHLWHKQIRRETESRRTNLSIAAE